MKAQRSVSSIEPTRFDERGPIVIAGITGHFSGATLTSIPELWMRFAPHIGTVPGQIGDAAYGVVSGMSGDREGFEYTAGVEVSEDVSALPAGFSRVRIPAESYAVFTHRGHASKISETVGAIWNEWLPRSGWAVAEGPNVIERYGQDFDPKTASGIVEILIPLKS